MNLQFIKDEIKFEPDNIKSGKIEDITNILKLKRYTQFILILIILIFL